MENETTTQAPPTRNVGEVIEIMRPVFDWASRDANGEPVVITDSGAYPPDPDTCREIVAAVNDHKRLLGEIAAAAEIICGYMGECPGMLEPHEWLERNGYPDPYPEFDPRRREDET